MKRFIYLIAMILGHGLIAQSITNAEYYFNTDPGFGNGNGLTVNANTGELSQSFSVPTTGLSNGLHSLFIRVLDDNAVWSHYDRQLIYVSKNQNINFNIIAAEYYFDADPGFGSATNISVPNQSSFTTLIAIPQTLGVGIHKLFVRVKTEENFWSHYDYKLFYVGPNNTASLTNFEYYIDSDDTVFPVTVTNPNGQVISDISTTGLSQGTHIFYIRAVNSDGTWSMYDQAEFTIILLSINEEVFQSISLYPNPVKDILNISSSLNFNIEKIAIYGFSGKTVYTSTDNLRSLNISQLNSGVYILHLTTDVGTASYKIIKQ